MMNNLVVDIGNSSVKLAVFNGLHVAHKVVLSDPDPDQLIDLIREYDIQKSIISSVRNNLTEIEDILKKYTTYIRFSYQTPLPISIFYQSPETLGLDRLAGLMGARHFYPAQNVLVIDAGTCITYDLIDQQDAYYGGSISPGMQLRLKSLHHFTGKLPMVDLDPYFQQLQGRDTRESILSGVMNGILAEVQGIIESYHQKYPDLQVILCGGDARFFDTRLKNSIFANIISLKPDLVLIGLNEIILHQHDQKN